MRQPGDLARVLVVGWLLVLSVVTWHRAGVWTDPARIWRGAVAHSPQKPRPWHNLGQVYAQQGESGQATAMLTQASVLAQAPERSFDEQTLGWAMAETNLALLDLNAGKIAEARLRLEGVIRRTPRFQTPLRVYRWIGRTHGLPLLPSWL